jgi:hypothetical protein
MSKNYKDKIDTQGMSGGPIDPNNKNSLTKTTNFPVDPITGETIYPPFKPLHVSKMIDGDLRTELKELINEVLDEREVRRYTDSSIDSTIN